MNETLADLLKSKLRTDLKNAMKQKLAEDVAFLRSLIGEIENAEAVPIGNLHDRYNVLPFGDPSVEVPRRSLSHSRLRDLLADERSSRLSSAESLDAGRFPARAAQLRREADMLGRYLEDW